MQWACQIICSQIQFCCSKQQIDSYFNSSYQVLWALQPIFAIHNFD
jgi:hypothetical protein